MFLEAGLRRSKGITEIKYPSVVSLDVYVELRLIRSGSRVICLPCRVALKCKREISALKVRALAYEIRGSSTKVWSRPYQGVNNASLATSSFDRLS